MRLAGIVEFALEYGERKAAANKEMRPALMRRISRRALIAILALKALNEAEGFEEPDDFELRELWNILKEEV